MKAVGIRELKDNPTSVLHAARQGPVVITNRDDPEALLLSLRDLGPDEPDVRAALATSLFDQGALSLGRAARLAGVPLEAFVTISGRAVSRSCGPAPTISITTWPSSTAEPERAPPGTGRVGQLAGRRRRRSATGNVRARQAPPMARESTTSVARNRPHVSGRATSTTRS